MEIARFYGTLPDPESLEADERIYLGAQFCPRLLPAASDLEKTISGLAGRSLTLLFPFIPQSFHRAAEELIELFAQTGPHAEVVVQNWGLIETAGKRGCRPVAGRLLTKQPKDPRLLRLFDQDAEHRFAALRATRINRETVRILQDLNVSRIELDLTPWGLELPPLLADRGLKVSIHLPYSIVSVTRYCKLAQINSSRQLLQISECSRQCRNLHYHLDHPDVPSGLLLYGNAFLYQNEGNSEEFSLPQVVDRLVYDHSVG